MKELLKRYRDIQDDHDTLNALSDKYIGIDDETTTIEQALLVTANCLTSVSHEIVRELQQELTDAAEQLNKPKKIQQPIFQLHPLYVVVPKDEPDNVWRTDTGRYDCIKYQVFSSKEKAEKFADSLSGNGKVVPVWGE